MRKMTRGFLGQILLAGFLNKFRSRPGLGIRICMDPRSFELLDPDPDPGGQKLPTNTEKIKNFYVLKCWMFSFEG